MKVVERVTQFDAIQFTGGKKNAKKVIKWLRDYRFEHAGWSPEIESPELCTGKTDEAVLIYGRGVAMSVPVGWWLVITDARAEKLERFCDDDFKAIYRPAKEDD